MSRRTLPSAWQQRWNQLAAREQRLLRAAAVLMALALLWTVLLAPPLKALRNSPTRHAQLGAQWQQMQALQAEAERLRSQPRAPQGDAAHSLRTLTVQHLGDAAQVQISAGRATVQLTQVPAAALAGWLAQLRSTSQAVPQQAQLTRSTEAPWRWSGALVLALPAP